MGYFPDLLQLPKEEIPYGRIINPQLPDFVPDTVHFTEVLDLSGFKKPVLCGWNPDNYSGASRISYYFTAVPDGHCAISSLPCRNEISLLPNIERVKLGFYNIDGGACGTLYTIGELPENKEDIKVPLTMTLVKGIIDEDSSFPTLEPVEAENGEWKEAEVSYAAPELPSLTQAYVDVAMYNKITYIDELTDGGTDGQFTCVVKTAQGEVPMIYVGVAPCFGEGQDIHRFLLPADTGSIILRWRAPAGSDCLINNGAVAEHKTHIFCTAAVQPGYGSEPKLGYSIADLTYEFSQPDQPGYETIDLQPTTNIMPGFDSSGYDFNGDGRLNWYSYKDYNNSKIYGIAQFQQSLGGSNLIKEYSSYSIGHGLAFRGFTPLAVTDKTVGYDDKGNIYGIDNTYELSLFNSDDGKSGVARVDIDNDGNPDFLYTYDNSVVTIGRDGSATTSYLKTMTREEYYHIIPPGDNPLGSGVSFVGNPTVKPALFGSFTQVDINGDGYPDFVDPISGKYYMNLGNGTYVIDDFRGTLLFRDFDGDGISDFMVYNPTEKSITVFLQRVGNGQEAVERKLISGYALSADVWCRDFDGDGDVDILLPLSTGEMSLLVMFENKGDGSFKKKEYPLEGAPEFAECIDWDADGCYEVVTHGKVDKEHYAKPVAKFDSYKITGLKVATEPQSFGISSSYDETIFGIIDVDNSGSLQWLIGNKIFSPKNAGKNSRPSKPAPPRLTFDESKGELTVSWPRGADAETPSADLTYELSIGTSPHAGDIMRPSATAAGLRRSPRPGNCGYELKRKFNTASWPQGNVYVTLQVVDDSGLGSEFSEPAVMTKNIPAAAFALVAVPGAAVYDEILAKVTSEIPAGAYVEWDFGDGTITSQSSDEARGYFTTMGEKTVTLRITSGGATATVAQSIDVKPIRIEEDANDMWRCDIAVDLDLDGVAELYDGSYFYEGDADGNYKKINRLFNTNWVGEATVIDVNRDGFPDIYHSKGILVNEGDKSMDPQQPDGFKKMYMLPDLDNDGARDASSDGKLFCNSGDYVNFINTGESAYIGDYYLDANGDGLFDGTNNTSTIFENTGDFRFEEKKYDIFNEEGIYSGCLGDFDGDGKIDIVYHTGGPSEGYIPHIQWSDGTRMQLNDIALPRGYSPKNIDIDLDNNGCNDLIMGGAIYFFNPDHTFSIVKVENMLAGNDLSCPIYRRSDGKVGISNRIMHCAPNELPAAPANVRATVSDTELVIEWDAAIDKETPSAAMRYNLSVKRKGVDGEGAYVISPLNGGIDGVPVPTDAYLLSSTRFAIPLIAVAKGEYEIKVQAIDGRREAGNFSAPAYCTVNSMGYKAPTEVMAGNTATLTFSPEVNLSDVNYGEDSHVEKIAGQTAYVYWSTAGVKTITAPDLNFEILVHPRLNAYFSGEPQVMARGATLYLNADNGHNSTWYSARVRADFNMVDPYIQCEVSEGDADGVVKVKPSTSHVGSYYKLKHVLEEPWGSDEYETEIYVSSGNEPEIGIVDIDDATGKYSVCMNGFGEDVESFILYRETSQTGEYECVTTALGAFDPYIDYDSEPKERPSRYAVKNRFWYGESGMSKAHQPIHVQINAGINGEWNLSWNKYEGREASTYRILRGASQNELECIVEVSGNTTSYSDFDYSGGQLYYAIETLIAKPVVSRADSDAMWRSRSNTVDVSTSAISEIECRTNNADYFDLSGRRIDARSMVPGVYLRRANGVTVKILVK